MKRCNLQHCDAGISCIIKDIVLGTLQGTNWSFAPRRTVYGAGCCEEREGKHLLVQLHCFYSALMGAAFSCLRFYCHISTLCMATGDHGAFFNAFFLVVNHRSLALKKHGTDADSMWSGTIRPPPSTPPPPQRQVDLDLESSAVSNSFCSMGNWLSIQLSCWKVRMQCQDKASTPAANADISLARSLIFGTSHPFFAEVFGFSRSENALLCWSVI